MSKSKGPIGNKLVLWTMSWMTIMPLLSSLLATVLLYQNEELVSAFGALEWTLFYLMSCFTMAFALTPTTYIAIVSGYFLGYQGIIYLVIAYQMASIIGYFFAQRLDRGFVDELVLRYPKAKPFIERLKGNQLSATILSRVSPALPFALMNVVLSVSQVRFGKFFLGGIIGMLPRSVFFVWVGLQAAHLTDALNNKDHLYLTVFLTVAAALGIYLIFKPTQGRSK